MRMRARRGVDLVVQRRFTDADRAASRLGAPRARFALATKAAVALLVATSFLAGPVPSASAAGPEYTTRESESSSHGQGNGVSDKAYISSDGRYVTFRSGASNLVANDTNNAVDVFVKDRLTGVTVAASSTAAGVIANARSDDGSISADGRHVTFRSQASNLVANDTNGNAWDTFVKDLDTGTVERVSLSSAGAQGNGASFYPVLSADGRWVAFRSDATNLITGDTNGVGDIYLRDRQTGTTTRISVATGGAQSNAKSDRPAISDDGASSSTSRMPATSSRPIRTPRPTSSSSTGSPAPPSGRPSTARASRPTA